MKTKNILMIMAATCMVMTGCKDEKKADATGTFEATEVLVSNEIPGKLLSFNVEEGDTLQAGVNVGMVDTVQLYLSKLQLQKSDKSIKSNKPNVSAQISALNAQIANQMHEKARVESLLKSNAATTKQLDDIKSSIAILNGQLQALKSTLNNNTLSLDAQSSATQLQIAQIDDKLNKCHIASPINGIVLTKYAEAGELVASGRPLFKVADLNKVYLRVYLTAAQLHNIKLGQKVSVNVCNEDKKYEGKVTWISTTSEFTPKNIQTTDERENLVYAVKILVNNDGGIKLGMYGDLYL